MVDFDSVLSSFNRTTDRDASQVAGKTPKNISKGLICRFVVKNVAIPKDTAITITILSITDSNFLFFEALSKFLLFSSVIFEWECEINWFVLAHVKTNYGLVQLKTHSLSLFLNFYANLFTPWFESFSRFHWWSLRSTFYLEKNNQTRIKIFILTSDS